MMKPKFVLPTILGTIILVASIFVFQPLDEAQTVHDIIIGSQRPMVFVLLDGMQIDHNDDGTIDPPELILLYNGLTNAETADIEFNTNLNTLGQLDDDGTPADGDIVLEQNTGAGWIIVQTLDTTSTGTDHKDFSNIQGLRLRLVDDAAGGGTQTTTFAEAAYVSLTIVGT